MPRESRQPRVFPVVDLTDIPTSDDEGSDERLEVSNYSILRTMYRPILPRTKRIIPEARPEHIHFHLFSTASREHYKQLMDDSKITNIGFSINPYFDRALFAGEKIANGDFIVLYYGLRMSHSTCSALQKEGRPYHFSLSTTNEVVVDALGYPYGAAMANHSCSPNASLELGYLRGDEHAPYAYLKALSDIDIGDEIECNYRYIEEYIRDELKSIIRSGRFDRCRCLKPNCRQVFCPH